MVKISVNLGLDRMVEQIESNTWIVRSTLQDQSALDESWMNTYDLDICLANFRSLTDFCLLSEILAVL